MADTDTRVKDPLAQVFDSAAYEGRTPVQQGNMVPINDYSPAAIEAAAQRAMPAGGYGNLTTGMQGDVFQAQRVAAPRDMTRVMSRLRSLAAAAGKRYVYGWEVNDRTNNRKTWIEGPTIKLANDLAREYGNCMVDVRVKDEGAHWVFYARFIDLETGYTLVRAYQQRRGQKTGMKDEQRAMDMIFQIGQSKAIRNVVVNALETLADYCVDEAKGALLDRVNKNPDAARKYIVDKLKSLTIDVKRVESIYGRTAEHWTVPDMTRIYTELQSVEDGMIEASDVWPVPEKQDDAQRGKVNTRDLAVDKKPAETKETAKKDPAPPPTDNTQSENPDPGGGGRDTAALSKAGAAAGMDLTGGGAGLPGGAAAPEAGQNAQTKPAETPAAGPALGRRGTGGKKNMFSE